MKSLRELAARFQELVEQNPDMADLPVKQIWSNAGGIRPIVDFDIYIRETERLVFPNLVIFDTILASEVTLNK